MSLTSYRAAPPRVEVWCGGGSVAAPPRVEVCGGRAVCGGPVLGEEGVVLGRSGNDLLSRVLRHSTIGAEEFNGRVRDGIGFLAPRSDHRTGQGQRQVRPQGASSDLIRGPRRAATLGQAEGQRSFMHSSASRGHGS